MNLCITFNFHLEKLRFKNKTKVSETKVLKMTLT